MSGQASDVAALYQRSSRITLGPTMTRPPEGAGATVRLDNLPCGDRVSLQVSPTPVAWPPSPTKLGSPAVPRCRFTARQARTGLDAQGPAETTAALEAISEQAQSAAGGLARTGHVRARGEHPSRQVHAIAASRFAQGVRQQMRLPPQNQGADDREH
ncbi:MAG: hypothetical protein IPL72_13125 [Sulfuritalea sp.]|nr:hypothetical protein [Sulfuritalea sp.]